MVQGFIRSSGAGGGGGGDASVITYTPAVLLDWDLGVDPGNVDDALDQLAERVDDVENYLDTLSAPDVLYEPMVLNDWDDAVDPGNVDAALDQLAARLTVGYVYLPARLWWPSTTDGCAPPNRYECVTNDVDIYHLSFDKDTQEYAQVMTDLPGWYGLTITAIIKWTVLSTPGAGLDGVRMGVQGRSYGNLEGLDQAWGVAQEVTDVCATALAHAITAATPAITLAGTPGVGETVQLRLYRNVSHADDDLDQDACILGVGISYLRRAA